MPHSKPFFLSLVEIVKQVYYRRKYGRANIFSAGSATFSMSSLEAGQHLGALSDEYNEVDCSREGS